MNERGIFYRKVKHIDFDHLDYNTEVDIDYSTACFSFNLSENDTLLLRTISSEPKSGMKSNLDSNENCQIEKIEYYKEPKYSKDRTIDILNSYHKSYQRKKKN